MSNFQKVCKKYQVNLLHAHCGRLRAGSEPEDKTVPVRQRSPPLVALLDPNQRMWTLLFFQLLIQVNTTLSGLKEFGGDTCTKPKQNHCLMVSAWYVQKWSKRAKQMSWQTMYRQVRFRIASLWSYKKVRIIQAKMFSLPRDKRNSTSSKLCPLHTCLSCLRPICSCHALGG